MPLLDAPPRTYRVPSKDLATLTIWAFLDEGILD